MGSSWDLDIIGTSLKIETNVISSENTVQQQATASHIYTMNIVMTIQSLLFFMTITATTTLSCSCFVWPTLDFMLEEETAYVFRGFVIPRFMSPSSSSNTGRADEYAVWIQKVHRNACTSEESSGITLSKRQIIAVTSPRNSCGYLKLPMLSSVLFASYGDTVSDSNGNNRLLQEDPTPTMHRKNATSHHTIRRAASTKLAMNVNLCSSFIQFWSSLSISERNSLSDVAPTTECTAA